ncbi:MmgE/PrpD family protein [Rhodococcus triatomae]|nr:MmgE/PrpD family protein [Rhodococcus triatomae BKS 15-14]
MVHHPPGEETAVLANWISGLTYKDLVAPVQSRIPLHVLDFVAVAAAGKEYAESSNVLHAAAYDPLFDRAGAAGGSTVIGENATLRTDLAAFLNGAYAHSLDFDDTTIASSLHPGAPVIAAALPLAESLGVTGTQLITALAAGYEITCRVGEALGQSPYERGFHPTGLAGIFGAVAAGAHLLGLDASRTTGAFGVAGSMAAGSLQCLEDGTWNKRIHPGLAARNALFALELARHGFHGAIEPLSGKHGVLQAFSSRSNSGILTDGLGTSWALLNTGIKPYPACRLTHGAIDAALEMRTRLEPEYLGRTPITLEISPIAHDIVGTDTPVKRLPRTTVDGQFSVYFQVAAALQYGDLGWSVYDHLENPGIGALIERIEVVANPGVNPAGAFLTIGEDVVRVDAPSGEPDGGIDHNVVARKFRSISSTVWNPDHQSRILSAVGDLPRSADVSNVIRLLRA